LFFISTRSAVLHVVVADSNSILLGFKIKRVFPVIEDIIFKGNHELFEMLVIMLLPSNPSPPSPKHKTS
jgi:hypothetical protein